METLGQKINPILIEIENTLWESNGMKPEFPDESLRAATKIFMEVILDKTFDLQNNENMDMEDRLNMAQRIGEDLRKLIKTYADVDSHDFYK